MYDLKAVELELHNARQARIAAELACSDVEELAAAIRQSHILWTAAGGGAAFRWASPALSLH